jgi:hypothetical protein
MSRLKNNRAVREQPDRKHRSIHPESDFSKSDSNESSPGEIDVCNAGSLDQHAALLGDTSSGKLSDTLHRAMVVRQLQRNFGNRYVSRLLDHVSRRNSTGIQAKMAVGPAGDKYEREADHVAKQVLGQMKGAGQQPVQRQGIEEDELQMKRLQRQIGMEGGDVGPELEQSIEKSRGKGQALPKNLRRSMEGPFGEDFSGVRVHTDAQAHDLNDSVSARAFTTGQDIYFRKGEYNPGSEGGKEILAHELTHVVQQNANIRKSPPIQRTLDGELIATYKQLLGLKTVAIAEIPDDQSVKANTPLGDYPQTSLYEVSPDVQAKSLLNLDYGKSDSELEANPEYDAEFFEYFQNITAHKHVTDSQGGGAFLSPYNLAVICDGASDRALLHEMGHAEQLERLDAKVGDAETTVNQIILEYHNVVKNENRYDPDVLDKSIEQSEMRESYRPENAKKKSGKTWSDLLKDATEEFPLNKQLLDDIDDILMSQAGTQWAPRIKQNLINEYYASRQLP